MEILTPGAGDDPLCSAIPEVRPGLIRAINFLDGVKTMEEQTLRDQESETVDRRGFLECMAWAGTGLLWSAAGGVLSCRAFGQGTGAARATSFSFV